jgi:hypothetical protein
MKNNTASAAGGAMPAEGHKSRRAALALFGSAPALAILPAAASPSTATLTALIEARREAWAAFGLAVDALEAAEPDKSVLVPCLAREPTAVEARTRKELINLIEENFEFEVEKLNLLLEMSPELGAASRDRLAKKRDACRARLDEVFAAHMAAEEPWQETSDADEDALMAICAHRCATMEEAAIKVRYLAGLDTQLEPDQSKAFFASFLPEEEEIEASV